MIKYKEEDYVNKCIEFDVRYVGYHSEIKKGITIDFICKKHADKGIQAKDWSHFKSLKQPCSYCSGRKRSTSDAQKLVLNKNIIFVSEYMGVEKPIKCKCIKCGYEWISNRPIDLFKRENGCPSCAKNIKIQKRLKNQFDFENELSQTNPNIKIIGKYIGSHKYIKCQCKIDGYVWESYACNLLNQSAGCPICNNSVGENKIIGFMEKYNINYTRQKSFNDCRDKLPLRFDVYDEDNNIAIEFQGEQHYYPVDFETNNSERAQKQFIELQKRDKIKKRYCLDNKITLICIPYFERNNVENYLKEHNSIYKLLA